MNQVSLNGHSHTRPPLAPRGLPCHREWGRRWFGGMHVLRTRWTVADEEWDGITQHRVNGEISGARDLPPAYCTSSSARHPRYSRRDREWVRWVVVGDERCWHGLQSRRRVTRQRRTSYNTTPHLVTWRCNNGETQSAVLLVRCASNDKQRSRNKNRALLLLTEGCLCALSNPRKGKSVAVDVALASGTPGKSKGTCDGERPLGEEEEERGRHVFIWGAVRNRILHRTGLTLNTPLLLVSPALQNPSFFKGERHPVPSHLNLHLSSFNNQHCSVA